MEPITKLMYETNLNYVYHIKNACLYLSEQQSSTKAWFIVKDMQRKTEAPALFEKPNQLSQPFYIMSAGFKLSLR